MPYFDGLEREFDFGFGVWFLIFLISSSGFIVRVDFFFVSSDCDEHGFCCGIVVVIVVVVVVIWCCHVRGTMELAQGDGKIGEGKL